MSPAPTHCLMRLLKRLIIQRPISSGLYCSYEFGNSILMYMHHPCQVEACLPHQVLQGFQCHAPNTNNNVIALHTIGVTGQHEVLMVGRYTGDPAKVGCESKSRYCSTTHKDRSKNLPGMGGGYTGYLTTTSRY